MIDSIAAMVLIAACVFATNAALFAWWGPMLCRCDKFSLEKAQINGFIGSSRDPESNVSRSLRFCR
jgi:hypothetical protein